MEKDKRDQPAYKRDGKAKEKRVEERAPGLARRRAPIRVGQDHGRTGLHPVRNVLLISLADDLQLLLSLADLNIETLFARLEDLQGVGQRGLLVAKHVRSQQRSVREQPANGRRNNHTGHKAQRKSAQRRQGARPRPPGKRGGAKLVRTSRRIGL